MRPQSLGVAACALIAVGSFGAGATRYRGGLLRAAHLEHLSYGHGRAPVSYTHLTLPTKA